MTAEYIYGKAIIAAAPAAARHSCRECRCLSRRPGLAASLAASSGRRCQVPEPRTWRAPGRTAVPAPQAPAACQCPWPTLLGATLPTLLCCCLQSSRRERRSRCTPDVPARTGTQLLRRWGAWGCPCSEPAYSGAASAKKGVESGGGQRSIWSVCMQDLPRRGLCMHR